MTTLLVLYRRPEGGPEALETFERRYATEHMPLVAQTPGLRATRIQRQLPDGRLFVVPDCGHEVMVRRPGLFNEALTGFYRSTEAAATARATEPATEPATEAATSL